MVRLKFRRFGKLFVRAFDIRGMSVRGRIKQRPQSTSDLRGRGGAELRAEGFVERVEKGSAKSAAGSRLLVCIN